MCKIDNQGENPVGIRSSCRFLWKSLCFKMAQLPLCFPKILHSLVRLPLGSIHMVLYNSYNGLLIVALKLFKKQYQRKWFYGTGTFCLAISCCFWNSPLIAFAIWIRFSIFIASWFTDNDFLCIILNVMTFCVHRICRY